MEKQTTGVGRRKEAVTRVFVTKGDGKITVNDKDYKTYFSLVYLQNQVERPLKTIDAVGKFDIKINATGGGVKGQAEAAMLGISRILVELNPEFRPALKAAGLLKRDPRSVERKKFGHKKARKSFQFSKR
ncbi:MAG: 30S ribosomal protein S9 [Chitinophagaceae bacterium]|jgi:small subunit ribosomal protein S9